MPINVGVSELPGRTFGKMQVMSNVQAGLNLRAAIYELEHVYGEIVTVNEADRSRHDQDVVWFEYLNGGPLAAVRYTSTHDAINIGNAADLGGPGGAVLGGTRAHRLLDGNHPEGVVGRKWGIFNTGAGFWRPESWHFNIYPARAQKLATLADSTAPKPTPEPEKDEFDMTIISLEYTDEKLPVARTAFGRWPIVNSTIPGSGYPNDRVETPVMVGLIQKIRSADPKVEKSIKYNGAERNIIDYVFRRCQDQMRKDIASEVITALKQQGVIK